MYVCVCVCVCVCVGGRARVRACPCVCVSMACERGLTRAAHGGIVTAHFRPTTGEGDFWCVRNLQWQIWCGEIVVPICKYHFGW